MYVYVRLWKRDDTKRSLRGGVLRLGEFKLYNCSDVINYNRIDLPFYVNLRKRSERGARL